MPGKRAPTEIAEVGEDTEKGGAPLIIRIKRHAGGAVSLTCTRADGSSTWQRFEGPTARVFPGHDLTHYAVETTLGFRGGFYGLLADGWNIQDFAAPWPRGEIPPEAREVELIVGFFESEGRQGEQWSAAEFEAHAELFVGAALARGKAVPPRTRSLTDAEITAVRACREQLLARWFATPPDHTLELAFSRGQSR
jgi:hypothetical protein